jgi:septum formation protein
MTTATGRQLVLASASPRRRELIAGLGYALLVDPCTIPEPERRPDEPPAAYAVRTALVKAREVASRHPRDFIIGADTIVVARNHILGKPASLEEAGNMLRSLSGCWHEVFTGICLIDGDSGRQASAFSCSRVHMRRLTRAEIDWYLSTGEYRDKAGAYAIQGYASLFIDRIEGCYFNIVGFPIFTFAQLCRRLRVPPFPEIIKAKA